MPIIDALSFDRGFHFSSIDYSGHLTSARDTSNYVDGVASLAFPTNSLGSHLNWVRHNFNAQHPTQPSTSLYVWPRSWYSSGDGKPRIYFTLGSTDHKIELVWNGYTHTYDLYIDDVLKESGSIIVSQNDFMSLQFWAKIDSSAGFVKVKIDGHLSIDFSGDTQPSGATSYADFCYVQGGQYALGGDSTSNIDNWVLGYNEFLGDCHVDELVPDGDSTTTEWTPITGSDNYAMVDETTPDEDDYNYVNTTGKKDKLTLEDWDNTTPNGITKDPVAVVAWMWSKATTATGEEAYVGIDSNGVESKESFPQFMNNQRYAVTILKDPNTGSDWTDSGIDSLLLMYESNLSA